MIYNRHTPNPKFIFKDINSVADFARHTIEYVQDVELSSELNDYDLVSEHFDMLMSCFDDVKDDEYIAIAIEYIRPIIVAILVLDEYDMRYIVNIANKYGRGVPEAISALIERISLLL